MSEIEKISLRLPKIPRDSYYEDYVAALLNAGGYYLQRSIHRYVEGVEMLELDVVATKISADTVEKTVIEIKSGNWGIKDVFKVVGWLQYLQIKNATGAFIFQNEAPMHDYEMMRDVAKNLHVELIQNKRSANDELDDSLLKDSFGINLDGFHESIISSFRYAFNMERVFIDYVHQFSKENPQLNSPKMVYEYLRKLNNESFLYQEPIARLTFLSDLSYEYRFIGGIMYHEIKGDGLLSPEEHPDFNGDYFSIFYPKTSDLTPVYVAQYATLLNKLFVLEAIVEHIVQTKTDTDDIFQNLLTSSKLLSLNGNVRHFIESLKSKPTYYIYPYFWQVFLYVFGGFILNDRKEKEYELLSKITKLPKEEIDDALDIWNELFPLNNGWFQKPTNNSNIYALKMMPAPLYGIGANLRLHLYGNKEIEQEGNLFDNLKSLLTGQHTFDDVNGWNNSAYYMLKRDINLHVNNLDEKGKYEKRLLEVEKYIKGCGRYYNVMSFEEVIQSKRIRVLIPNGFVGYYEDNTYDIYVVKNNNRNEKLNIFQYAKDLKLNESLFVNGVILGTDESIAEDKADKVWYFTRFEQKMLSEIEDIINNSNLLHNK